MDMYESYYSVAFHSAGDSSSTTSSSSDNGSSGGGAISSEERVVLASNKPKKSAGQKKFRVTRHPVYRGVRQRDSGKWVSEVREPKKKSRIWLGSYVTAEMAARAHDVAAIALKGRAALLNFADSTWRLPIPASSSAKDIRKAAAEAAEAFRPGSAELSRTAEGATSTATVTPTATATVTAVNAAPTALFVDEEAIFGMHELLFDMAEGLMLPPPHFYNDVAIMDDADDIPLWSYSF